MIQECQGAPAPAPAACSLQSNIHVGTRHLGSCLCTALKTRLPSVHQHQHQGVHHMTLASHDSRLTQHVSCVISHPATGSAKQGPIVKCTWLFCSHQPDWSVRKHILYLDERHHVPIDLVGLWVDGAPHKLTHCLHRGMEGGVVAARLEAL
eukprot:scaffold134460_cov24-Tisochrysis_lutea.AAC.1